MKTGIRFWLAGALALAVASILVPQSAMADIRQEVLILALATSDMR